MNNPSFPPPRVGIGYDVHRLVEGRPLVLGGVEIEHPQGLEGHSDADSLTHAVIDAIFGAAGLGNIGEHFPAGDPRYLRISSLELLAEAGSLVAKAGFEIINVDSVIVAERPRLQPHLAEMAARIATRLGLDAGQVGVKATSPESLGSLGRREGIAAQAVALVVRSG